VDEKMVHFTGRVFVKRCIGWDKNKFLRTERNHLFAKAEAGAFIGVPVQPPERRRPVFVRPRIGAERVITEKHLDGKT
jgi:hypothetical protein